MKLKITLLLAVAASSLYGMDVVEKKETTINGMDVIQDHDIDWNEYKKLFFKYWAATCLGTPPRWEALKKGVEEGSIKLMLFDDTIFGKSYLAYAGPFKDDEGRESLFMYPSSISNFGPILHEQCSSASSAYCILPPDWRTYIISGWKQIEKLPEDVIPNPEYFPSYKSNELAPYELSLENNAKEEMTQHCGIGMMPIVVHQEEKKGCIFN